MSSAPLPSAVFLSDLASRIHLFSLLHVRPPAPPLRPRPAHLILSSMRGDVRALETDQAIFDADEQKPVIRFFVSSTFDDTKHERDVLIKCVLPAAQRYARAIGFEVVLSEMRFGIRKSLGDDHKTTEVCMAELQRCVQSSHFNTTHATTMSCARGSSATTSTSTCTPPLMLQAPPSF
jgi:hypothetical protein